MPGIAVEPGVVFQPGDRLVLKRPDGSIIISPIGGFLEVGYNTTREGVTRWVAYDSSIAIPTLTVTRFPPAPRSGRSIRRRSGGLHILTLWSILP